MSNIPSITRWSQLNVTDMNEANLNWSGPGAAGTTLFSAAYKYFFMRWWYYYEIHDNSQLWKNKKKYEPNLPDPTAKIPACGGFMMAQNCLMPNGPPKLDTVNVPPCIKKSTRQSLCEYHKATSTDRSLITVKCNSNLIIFWL